MRSIRRALLVVVQQVNIIGAHVVGPKIVHVLQGGSERPGAQRLHVSGNGHGRKFLLPAKCRMADRCHAVRDQDFLDVGGAQIERQLANGGHAILDDDSLNLILVFLPRAIVKLGVLVSGHVTIAANG